MSRIERLTPEQTARFEEFRDRWIKIGLSTDPADRPRAEAAIRSMYTSGGLTPPRKIVWCGSPLSQGLTRVIVLDFHSRASVRDSVSDSVLDSVLDSVRASVFDSVLDSVSASVLDSVRASVRGAHEAAWLSFYSYMREVLGLTHQTEKLAGLTELAQSAGWALPHSNICWVSERHNVLMRDERGRLHSLVGPAVAYSDGWKIYAVHGVRVPASIIESPQSITVQSIESEQNAEIRRVMTEQYGPGRYLRESGATLVNKDRRGKLWRKEQPGDEPLVMVEVVNSTPEPDGHSKTYFLRVTPEVKTASEAVAWTFGIEKARSYRPNVET